MARSPKAVVCWEVRVADSRQPVASQASLATGFVERLKGLLGRRTLPEGHAVIFPRCNSVHTWGMRFPIDLLFVDRKWRVVSLQSQVPPWRFIRPVWKAWAVMETAAGTLQKLGLQAGDQLSISPAQDLCGASMP